MLANGQASSHFKSRETNSLDKRLSPGWASQTKTMDHISMFKMAVSPQLSNIVGRSPGITVR